MSLESDVTLLTSSETLRSVNAGVRRWSIASERRCRNFLVDNKSIKDTEKGQRFVQPSNFLLTTKLPIGIRLWHSDALYLELAQVQKNGAVFRLYTIAVRHRTVWRVCSRSANHVHKSQLQHFVIDVLDGNADVTYSSTCAVAVYTA